MFANPRTLHQRWARCQDKLPVKKRKLLGRKQRQAHKALLSPREGLTRHKLGHQTGWRKSSQARPELAQQSSVHQAILLERRPSLRQLMQALQKHDRPGRARRSQRHRLKAEEHPLLQHQLPSTTSRVKSVERQQTEPGGHILSAMMPTPHGGHTRRPARVMQIGSLGAIPRTAQVRQIQVEAMPEVVTMPRVARMPQVQLLLLTRLLPSTRLRSWLLS
mmetsp:Transcript_79306/g.139972  ORF Transcript_79306/g.139972 Transcript_79306/m.139972 type:complete len:219 (+) Transcript_79306:206-862(+)